MKYHAEKFSLFCDCDWHVLDDDGCSVVERVRESFAREIVRALNRDKLYAEMVAELKWQQDFECKARCYYSAFAKKDAPKVHLITCQRLTDLLTKIKVAEKGGEW